MKRQMPTCGVCVTEANHELCRTDDEAPFCHNMSPWSQELTACSAGHGAWHGGGQERRKNIQVGDVLLAAWDAGKRKGLGSCLQRTPVSWAPRPLYRWET